MEKIHIRNIFQVFVPLDFGHGSGTIQTKQEPFGLDYIQYDLVLTFHVRIMFTDIYGNILHEPKGCLTWAKRAPAEWQQNTADSRGMALRLKINQGVFDFRKNKDRLFKLMIELIENGDVMKTGTSSIWELFPKRRQLSPLESGGIEAVVPISWIAEDQYPSNSHQQSNSEDLSLRDVQCIQDSPFDEEPIQMADPNQSSDTNLFQLTYQHPSEDSYHSPNMNVNDNYTVLYNGNAEVVGNFRALNFYKASDINIKEDIQLLDQARDCRAAMLQINGVEYKFKKGINHATNKRFIGYIAQQIESVVPEAVQLIDGILHVDYESLIPYLSESMKQNYNDVQSVTSEVFQIKHVLDTLYERFTASEKKQETTVQTQTKLSRRMKHVIGWTVGVLAFSAILSVAILWISLGSPTSPPNAPPNITPYPTPYQPVDSPVPYVPSDLERSALEAVFRALLSPDDERLQESNLKKSHCHWTGVTCDFSDRVIELFLTGVGRISVNSTAPYIHEAIGNFPELERLFLDDNGLYLTIPASIANLTKLTYLSLENNHLTGTVPDLQALKKLEILRLDNNMLTGSLAHLLAIPALKKLTAVSNQFNTELPDIISTTLTEIRLSNCQLFGTIPFTWNLNDWKFIQLDRNNLTGSVPCFGSSLTHLLLESNNLNGQFCSSKLRSIHQIFLAANKFTGTFDLPEVDLTAAKLRINIERNLFSSFFPSALNVSIEKVNIVRCQASENPFECPLPQWAEKCLLNSCIEQ